MNAEATIDETETTAVGTEVRQTPLQKFATVLANTWVSLHRTARHRSAIPTEVCDRVLEILGGGIFEWCWSVIGIYPKTKVQRNNEKSAELLYSYISQPEIERTVCSKVCFTITMIAKRMQTLAEVVNKGNRSEEEKELIWKGYNDLFYAIYALLETGILAEMPHSLLPSGHNETALANFAEKVEARYNAHAAANGPIRAGSTVSTMIAETLGSRLFDGIRAQKDDRAGEGKDGLIEWYMRSTERVNHGFYADLGQGIHELTRMGKRLRDYLATAPVNTPRYHAANAAIGIVDKTLYSVLESGIMFAVPV